MIRRANTPKPESTLMNVSAAGRPPAPGLAVAAPLPRDVKVSFEFFPPTSEKAEETLLGCARRLAPLQPEFVSVTYGAGGGTRERTRDTVVRLKHQLGLTPAAHLTCVSASRAEVDAVARQYWDNGVRHIVALRGDPPEGVGTAYRPHPEGYAYASDLVAGLKRVGDFEISVAAYPQVHPEALSVEADLDNLKRKIDAGAERAITQYFFDVEVFLRFVERARDAGIAVPIVPGILPVTNFARVRQFSEACGATVPDWMSDLFAGLDDDPETRKLVAATIAAEQCRVLHACGVNDFHFYTLNRADLTYAICRILGVTPQRDSGDGDETSDATSIREAG